MIRESEFPEYLARARAGDAPLTPMRLRHWTVTRSRRGWRPFIAGGHSTGRWEEYWVALYAADAEPGTLPVVVLVVRPDPEILRLEQGCRVRVWGWPVPGGVVHIAHGDLPITADGRCDVLIAKRSPTL